MNMFSQEDLDAARAQGHATGMAEGAKTSRAASFEEGKAAGVKEGHATGLAEGKTLGATAERERIKSIVTHAEAKSRGTLASHFAFNTGAPVEEVAAALTAAPKESASGDRGPLGISTLGDKNPPSSAASWDKAVERVNGR